MTIQAREHVGGQHSLNRPATALAVAKEQQRMGTVTRRQINVVQAHDKGVIAQSASQVIVCPVTLDCIVHTVPA